MNSFGAIAKGGLLERTGHRTDILGLCSIKNRGARRFEQLTDETIRFIQEIERVAAAQVSLISTRFHSRSIIDNAIGQGYLQCV